MALVAGYLGIHDVDDENAASDGDFISDIAIGAFTASQTGFNRAVLKKPAKNGHSALIYDSVGMSYDFGDIFDLGTNSGIFFLVAKWQAGTPFGKLVGGDANRWGLILKGDTSTQAAIYQTGGATGGGGVIVVADSGDAPADSDFHLYELHINRTSGKLQIYRDTVLIVEQSFTPEPGYNHNCALNFTLGDFGNGTHQYFGGEIAYFVPYIRPTEFSDGEKAQNRGFFGERFALSYYAPPTAGFSIPSTLEASDTLEITDSSADGTGYEYRITNSAYTDEVVGDVAEPDLTSFLRMGVNTIKQIVFNNFGSDETEEVVTVGAKTISDIEDLDFTVTVESLGLTLRARVRAIDINGNPSEWTDKITAFFLNNFLTNGSDYLTDGGDRFIG